MIAADIPDVSRLIAEPSVAQYWGAHHSHEWVQNEILDDPDAVTLVIESSGRFAGIIQYGEEDEPDYHHAGIDIAVSSRFQGQGLGKDSLRTLAEYLITVRGHHRITIDPRASNERAIATYRAVGFRPVGVMRQYERDSDGVWCDGLLMDLLASELGQA